jgi:hypothetical protein
VSLPTDSRFGFLERIEYSSEVDDRDMRGFRAMERRIGEKHGTTWRDDQDRVIPVELFALVDIAVRRATGLVALVGYIGNLSHDDPDEFRGGPCFWVRRPGDSRFARVDLPLFDTESAGRPWAVDISPDSARIAVMWSLGREGAVCAIVDAATRSLDQIATVRYPDGNNLSGGESLRFSADGRWILITSAMSTGALLLDAEQQRVFHLALPGVGTAAWWPGRPGVLLLGRLSEDVTLLESFDLAEGDRYDVGRLELPDGLIEGEWPTGVRALELGPDGRSLLGLSSAATALEQSNENRPRSRLVRGELLDAPSRETAVRITQIPKAHLDRLGACAVEHSCPRWLEVRPERPFEIARGVLTAVDAR